MPRGDHSAIPGELIAIGFSTVLGDGGNPHDFLRQIGDIMTIPLPPKIVSTYR
jgi:hypothetical protein